MRKPIVASLQWTQQAIEVNVTSYAGLKTSSIDSQSSSNEGNLVPPSFTLFVCWLVKPILSSVNVSISFELWYMFVYSVVVVSQHANEVKEPYSVELKPSSIKLSLTSTRGTQYHHCSLFSNFEPHDLPICPLILILLRSYKHRKGHSSRRC
jgi:hypothetical protein